jgi:hypothetical protein
VAYAAENSTQRISNVANVRFPVSVTFEGNFSHSPCAGVYHVRRIPSMSVCTRSEGSPPMLTELCDRLTRSGRAWPDVSKHRKWNLVTQKLSPQSCNHTPKPFTRDGGRPASTGTACVH